MRDVGGYPGWADLARIAPGKGPVTSWVRATNPVPGSGPWGGNTRGALPGRSVSRFPFIFSLVPTR